MKTFRMLQTTIAVLMICVLASCGDQLTSSGASNENTVSNNVDDLTSSSSTFKRTIQVKLFPNQSFLLNRSTTGFDYIYSVSVRNLTGPELPASNCDGIFLYSANNKFQSCRVSGLREREITLVNKSANSVKYEVTMSGVIQSPIDPSGN